MVKKLCIFALFPLLLSATSFDKKIESYLGKKDFFIQKNLINILFIDEARYLKDDNSTNDVAILTRLKKSGLLKLFYSKPIEMEVSFKTKGSPLIFMRVVNESLEALGYSYFITQEVHKEPSEFTWKISLATEHIIDPVLLANEFHLRGCDIIDIIKESQSRWVYNIDSSHIKIRALKLETNTTIKLQKPIRDYWIDVSEAAKISIRSKLADRWFPNVVFYDKSLHVISYYTQGDVKNFVKLKVPTDARYVKVGDVYTLDNIKRGLSLYLYNKN